MPAGIIRICASVNFVHFLAPIIGYCNASALLMRSTKNQLGISTVEMFRVFIDKFGSSFTDLGQS